MLIFDKRERILPQELIDCELMTKKKGKHARDRSFTTTTASTTQPEHKKKTEDNASTTNQGPASKNYDKTLFNNFFATPIKDSTTPKITVKNPV